MRRRGLAKALVFAAVGMVGCLLGAGPAEVWWRLTSRMTTPEVSVLIDCSGSMAGEKFEEVKAATKEFVRRNVSRGPIGVVGFATTARPACAPTTDLSALEKAIDGLKAGGSTAMHAGLGAAAAQFRPGERARFLFLFTDGMPDAEIEALKVAEDVRRRGTTIVAAGTKDARRLYLDRLTGDPKLVFEASAGRFDEAFGRAGEAIAALVETAGGGGSLRVTTVRMAGWCALLAALLAPALIAGQNLYLRRPGSRGGKVALAVFGGLFAGLVGGAAGQILFAAAPHMELARQAARVAGWTLVGMLVGAGVSFVVPNLKVLRAAVGGGVGGALGAAGFQLTALQVGDFPARFVGAGILGLLIGLMIAVAEVAFRQAWLEVIYGPRESSTVTLGNQPVSVGSDSRACAVYAQGAPPVACRFRFDGGKVTCQDAVSGRVEVMKPGDRKTVGAVRVVVGAAREPELVGAR